MSSHHYDLLAKAFFHTRRVDRLLHLATKARQEFALLVKHQGFFDAFNEIAYSHDCSYKPRSGSFRRELFAWEKEVIAKHFPTPPSRVLVGGAGGGREAFALAEQGYQVVAFEPTYDLAAQMREQAQRQSLDVDAYVGNYQVLWKPDASVVAEGSIPVLPASNELGSFDAILLGWGSLTHVYDPRDRQRLFEVCREMLAPGGRLLASYFGASRNTNAAPGRLTRLKLALRKARGVDPNDCFYIHAGFGHAFTPEEIEELAHNAGLEVVFTHAETLGTYPHCVLQKPRDSNR